jgi:hypothetical protein
MQFDRNSFQISRIKRCARNDRERVERANRSRNQACMHVEEKCRMRGDLNEALMNNHESCIRSTQCVTGMLLQAVDGFPKES